MKEWKDYQEIYRRLVTEHTDARHLHKRVMSDEKVDNAIRYVQAQDDYGIYPAKSYIIAIIYAFMIQEVYGEDLYESLNDPELLPQDDFFVTYEEDSETYDAILTKLEEIPDWIKGGWAPRTVEYFYAECTQEGVNSINGVINE
jgi:hypothetical protein